jgi:anti-sigma factor RsiW
MRCANVGDVIASYADGLADERGRRIAERHMRLCQDCRRRVQLLHRLGQQLVRMPLLPPGMSERTPRLRRELEARLARRRRLRAFLLVAGLAVVAAALVLLMVLVIQ